MLKKLNEKNNFDKDLYQNVQTGTVSTLAEANFSQSMRRTNRHMNDNPKYNNRASHGEMFVQFIGSKRIFHFSPAALLRKEAVFNFYKSIEDNAAKFNKFIKANYGKA